jgi:hypothetical protein
MTVERIDLLLGQLLAANDDVNKHDTGTDGEDELCEQYEDDTDVRITVSEDPEAERDKANHSEQTDEPAERNGFRNDLGNI